MILKFDEFLNEKRSDRVMTAKELLQKDFGDVLEFEGKWEHMFGKPSPNFSMMLTGAPSSGKTTLLLEFAYYLAVNFGKVIYISTEEFGSKTLQDKLKLVVKNLDKNGGDNKFFVPDQLYFSKGMADLTDYDFVIIDSVSDVYLDIENYKELSDIYPQKAFILVLQYTKAGQFRGTKEWEHEVDIYSEISGGVVSTIKNRFFSSKELFGLQYDYFNDKVIKPKEVNEGVWSLPFTAEQADELWRLMQNHLPCSDAPDMLYNIFGDDDLYDKFFEYEDDDDVRIEIQDSVKKLLKYYNSEPQSFKNEAEKEALETLEKITKIEL